MEFFYTRDADFFNNPRIVPVKFNNKCYCFRTFVTKENAPSTSISKVKKRLLPYEDNETDMVNCTEVEDNFNISVTNTGNYVLTFKVAPQFYSHIIGAKGAKKRELEIKTGVRIKIPSHGEKSEIVITGSSERSVVKAANRVNVLVFDIRSKFPPTHFVSIPVVSSQIIHNFGIFKEQICTQHRHSRGISESLFQNPEKLHLTITTVVLLSETEIDEANKALHECKNKYWESLFQYAEDMKIVMKGIEIMNDEPKDVDVLYGKVQIDPPKYTSNFQKFTNAITDVFVKKGLIRKQFDNVKLHVTLMNSLFRKEEMQKRETFNCEEILTKYKNFEFGKAELRNMHLSIRYTTNKDKNYYEAETVIALQK